MEALPEKLTSHSPAGLREVASLSFPFILVLFSGSLMGLMDRLILAHYSLQAVEGSLGAFYLLQLFQVPCIRIASTAQIFVAQYRGSGELSKIGPLVWQMIWFSLFSSLLLTPLSWPLGMWFFQQTAVHEMGQIYFHSLMTAHFLFPLSAALSSFYLGQGRTRRVLLSSLASHALHILLDFPLIFGVKGLFPPLGAQGAAFALITAQTLFCVLLLSNFLRSDHQHLFQTQARSFQWGLF